MIKILPLLFILFLISASSARALTIDSIGSVDTANQTFYSQWNYTSENPRLTGTTDADGVVDITIDSEAFSTTADSAGSWSYTPTTLTEGTHEVTVADASDSRQFTLVIGSQSTTNYSSSPSAQANLPQAGNLTPTLALALGGFTLMVLGYIVYGRK